MTLACVSSSGRLTWTNLGKRRLVLMAKADAKQRDPSCPCIFQASALSDSLTALASLAEANCVAEPSIGMGSVGNGGGSQSRTSVGESEVLSHESHLFLWMDTHL